LKHEGHEEEHEEHEEEGNWKRKGVKNNDEDD
jgi:hypothetical protein